MKITNALLSRFAPLFLMALFSGVSPSANAEDQAMPGGSWRETCKDASIKGGILYARCRQEDGQYRATSALLLANCDGYSNRNGQLYCEKKHGANSRWHGSYNQSCTDIAVDKHGRLSATCRRDDGKSNRTNITPKQCPTYRVRNDDGQLVCESKADAGNNRWGGSYAQSCREVTVNERGTLTATCQTKKGTWERTSLAAVNCNNRRADNDDGRLVCESRRESNNRWSGSFERTCRDIHMDASGTLTATCQNTRGAWVPTSLSARNCESYRAANSNGRLVCETQGNAGNNSWGGSYAQSCREITVSERGTLTATCQTKKGTWERTSLAAVNCTNRRADNSDGQLVCESQRTGNNRWEGSFEKSCRDIYMDASGTLTATCQNAKGAWVPTRLFARNCESYRAANSNGQLVCETQGNAGSNRWGGSYAQSCREIAVNERGTLTATCHASNGTWQRSSLAAANCNDRRADNDDGQLVCVSQRASSNRWEGSFAQTCHDIYMDASGTLTATCRNTSGAWVPARLAANNCGSYRAANMNGQLVCEGK